MPDFERRSSASFISSNDGGTPDSFRRSLMNRRSSYCLRVSISTNPQVDKYRVIRDPISKTCPRPPNSQNPSQNPSQKPEIRNPKSENRNQKTEVKNPEVRNQSRDAAVMTLSFVDTSTRNKS